MDTVYFSYWSGGSHTDYGRYLGVPTLVMRLHQISLHYAKKHYKNVHLITDKRCLPFFEKLGYTNITTELDELNNSLKKANYNWALGKLYSYKKLAEKGIPFVHLDYDVFIWKPLLNVCWRSPVIVQSIENPETFYYDKKTFAQIYGLDLYKQYGAKKYLKKYNFEELMAYNMGIFGGADLDFIKKYSEEAIQFSLDEKNEYVSRVMKQVNSSTFPCVCEQYLLRQIANNNDKQVECYLGKEPKSIELTKVANEIGYCHFHGLKVIEKEVQKLYKFVTEHEKLKLVE